MVTGLNQNILGSGDVADVGLRLSPTLASGPLTLGLTGMVATDPSANNVPLGVPGAGTLTVTANKAPVVIMGTNQTVTFPAPASLTATASDDGAPNPPGAMVYTWSAI